MERLGVCISCHREIPSGRLAFRLISKIGEVLEMTPKTDQEHQKLIGRAMFIAANVEVFGPAAAGIVAFLMILYFLLRRGRQTKKP